MRSRIAIRGHPIHPMLVPLPIGLAIWALVCDFVYLATGHDKMWYDMAFWSGIATWASALIAALPGFGDFLTMAIKSSAREIAVFHMLLNVTVVALYFIAMVLMLNANALEGGSLAATIVLHTFGVGLLSISGWLGGEMVYRHHLAVVADTAELEEAERSQHSNMRPRGI